MAKTFILSDESVNSYGFRVLTDGINLKQFKKNPVMLFNHKTWGEGYTGPIGRWENIRVEDGKLMADPVFDEKDEFALKIKSKVESGFIKGASMGFNIVETSTDEKMMDKGQVKPTVTKSIIYEASIVDLPGNANALALYDDSGNRIEIDAEQGIELSLNKIFQTPQKTDMVKLKTATLVKLQLSDNATPEQIEAAIEATLSRAENAEKELKTFKDAAAAEQKLRAEILVKQAVKDKKITASEEAEYLELAMTNFALAEKTLAKLSAPSLPGERIKPESKENNSDKGRDSWTLTDYRQKDPNALALIQKNEPEKFEQLLEGLRNNGK